VSNVVNNSNTIMKCALNVR